MLTFVKNDTPPICAKNGRLSVFSKGLFGRDCLEGCEDYIGFAQLIK